MWGAFLSNVGRRTSGTLTIALGTGAYTGYRGYSSGAAPPFGAISPAIASGYSILEISDFTTGPILAFISIGGFSANPGYNFLFSAQVGSSSKSPTQPGFSYGNGVARWDFPSVWGLASSGSTNFVVTLR